MHTVVCGGSRRPKPAWINGNSGNMIQRKRGSCCVYRPLVNSLAQAAGLSNSSLSPVLLAVASGSGQRTNPTATVTLFLDTVDNATQELYKGVFRLVMQSRDEQRGQVIDTPQLLWRPPIIGARSR